jgi:hypothetical protein
MSANLRSSQMRKSCLVARACSLATRSSSKSEMMSIWVYASRGADERTQKGRDGSISSVSSRGGPGTYLDAADVGPRGVDDAEQARLGRHVHRDAQVCAFARDERQELCCDGDGMRGCAVGVGPSCD